jgi:hypothetical protein
LADPALPDTEGKSETAADFWLFVDTADFNSVNKKQAEAAGRFFSGVSGGCVDQP